MVRLVHAALRYSLCFSRSDGGSALSISYTTPFASFPHLSIMHALPQIITGQPRQIINLSTVAPRRKTWPCPLGPLGTLIESGQVGQAMASGACGTTQSRRGDQLQEETSVFPVHRRVRVRQGQGQQAETASRNTAPIRSPLVAGFACVAPSVRFSWGEAPAHLLASRWCWMLASPVSVFVGARMARRLLF